jgi:hypothetical protein
MGKKARKLFNPKEPVLDQRRREWVELDNGWVCVWEMDFADTLFVRDQSLRPGPGGGQTVGNDAVLWQILVSCHAGEESGSPRTFEVTDFPRIQKLRSAESGELLKAIERVNGLRDEEVSALKSFTPPPPDSSPPT